MSAWNPDVLPSDRRFTYGKKKVRVLVGDIDVAAPSFGSNHASKDIISSEHLSADDLLRGHVKHAKKVRARLRKERLLRIERYKQRLSLLLPTQMELIGRTDASTPKR